VEPERWLDVERIYHAAMECAENQRALYLEQACAADEALRFEVESLLKYAERPAEFLGMPALEVMARALAEDLRAEERHSADKLIGARIAQYRIVGKLGAGGMGDVYRAVRADDQYEKHVAIKLVRQGLDTEVIRSRFRKERQILAGFEHENIARLLDGGTTDNGYPYFVMELVEGQPIDEYCDACKLGTAARLELFQHVCSAVQYAHQRLVVHRDIKPANILITADGVPKLLDFGIATILNPETASPAADPTITALRMMTPQFASPEQLRGGAITTATDVYSLGVVLYQLLTGHLPYPVERNSPYDLAHAICEVEPEKPSTAAGRFGQSIDANHGAADPTPERISRCRDSSPEKLRRALSGDLDQILLKALRKESSRRYASAQDFARDLQSYVLGRPVSVRGDALGYRSGKFIKRNKLSLAVGAVFALVVLAGAVAIMREARIARIQQARAERQFSDVRKLADSMLFEIHDSIRNLPGSTSARHLLVDRALQYLDSLSRESSGTPGLQQELATAYERVGEIQGEDDAPNVGDTTGSLTSYEKAAAIRESIAASEHNSPESLTNLSKVYQILGIIQSASGQFREALNYGQKALAIQQRLSEGNVTPETQEGLAGAYFVLGLAEYHLNEFQPALVALQKSAAIREGITTPTPTLNIQVRTRLSGTYGEISILWDHMGEPAKAILAAQQGLKVMSQLSASDPGNLLFREYMYEHEEAIGERFAEEGNHGEAESYLKKALTGFEVTTSADPNDANAKLWLGDCETELGRVEVENGDTGPGMANIRKGLATLLTLYRSDPRGNNDKLTGLAHAYANAGFGYAHLAAQPHISKAARVADWKQSRASYQKSEDAWRTAGNSHILLAQDAGNAGQMSQEVATCDAALAKLNSRSLSRDAEASNRKR